MSQPLFWLVSPSKSAPTISAVSSIQSGLPIEAADRLSQEISPGDSTFKYHFVPKATYARRRSAARLSAPESERLVRVGQLWTFALEVWGGVEAARRFMTSSHMLLDDRTPLDVALESELGGKVVENILGRLAHGTAV